MHNEARPGVWRGLHRGATPLRFPGDRPGFHRVSPGASRASPMTPQLRACLACSGRLRDQSPLSINSCRSHSGNCVRSRKCQLSPHPSQTTVFPSLSMWPPAVRRNSSLSCKDAECWQWWRVVRITL